MVQTVEERLSNKEELIVFEGDPYWSIILSGTAASKICYTYRKPTFIFKKGEKESQGAVRVPKGLDAVKAMMYCKKFLITFGGHPPAAGFRLDNKNLEGFKEFLIELRKGKFRFFSNEDVEKIESKKKKYRQELKRLSFLEKKRKLKEFIIRYTYNSSKLSGIAVTLRQTSLILMEGIIPKGFKSLRTVKELENHEKGIIASTKYKVKFDIKFIKKIHLVLFSGVDDTITGKLRSELKRDIKIAGTSYVPPRWNEVNKELEVKLQ